MKIIVHTPDEVIRAVQTAKKGDIIEWQDSAGIMHEYQKKKNAYDADLKQFLTAEINKSCPIKFAKGTIEKGFPPTVRIFESCADCNLTNCDHRQSNLTQDARRDKQ